MFVCIFKKDASYEMGISDLSSDVFSSYLPALDIHSRVSVNWAADDGKHHRREGYVDQEHRGNAPVIRSGPFAGRDCGERPRLRRRSTDRDDRRGPDWGRLGGRAARLPGHRSEEHTSELQSLMRISYAVFCLKKKKK